MDTFGTTMKRKKMPGESDTELVMQDFIHDGDITPKGSLQEGRTMGGKLDDVQRNNSRSITKTVTAAVSYTV